MATETMDATAQELDGEADVEEEKQVEEAEPSEFPVSLDNVFEILKNQRRRYVLRFLEDREEPVSLSDLSEHVAARENDKSVDQLSSQERKRVYVGLYQCHLPKMDDMGFINFNKNRGVIELGPAAPNAAKYLQDQETAEREWPRYYLSGVGIGWILLAMSSVGAGLLSATLASVLFLSLLTACALAHLHADRNGSDGSLLGAVTNN